MRFLAILGRGGTERRGSRRRLRPWRPLTMPERLEDRALPGGSLLGLLFGVPLAEPFLGSVWADGNPLGSDDLPGVNARRREHLAALEGLQRDRLLADELFGEVRRLVQIAGASTATADAYVDVARARLLGVAGSLAASDAAVLASHDFLADLWWTDELLTSLARGRALGAPRFLAELPVEGDDPEGMSMLGYGGYGNMPPVANDDSYYAKHDTNLSVPPPGVKSNDYDPNYDPLTASLVSGPSHAASFTFNSNGSFSYTPAYHYVGADSFVYRVSDGQYTDDATASINVYNNAPVANNDSYQTKHDVALNVSAPGVKSNDYDYDYDPMTAIQVTGPSHASSFTLNSNGSFSYTPAYHYVGVDTFTYKVNDGIANSNTATVSINVYNNAPVANNDSYQTKHDVTLDVFPPGVKSNDYDYDYDELTAILVTGPSHASSFTLNANGRFIYTPVEHYVGDDSFTYKVNDGIVDSATATVSINVYNNPPVAENDYYSTPHDTDLIGWWPGVTWNDYDWDYDECTAILVTGPSHAGSFALEANGSFEYRPAYHYVGNDTFTYKLNDGVVDSAIATVSINVTNNPPTAVNDGPYFTLPGIPLHVNPSGVLANDWDIDGDPFEAVLDRGPLYGYVGLDPNGSFTYVAPTPVGSDNFTYKAYDQMSYSAAATVTIEVPSMRLSWVDFKQEHEITKDPDGGSTLVYNEMHWLDANLDGDTDDPGDRKWPVAYTRSQSDTAKEYLRVGAQWLLDRTWGGGAILVRAEGPDGITIPPTVTSIYNQVVTLNEVAARQDTPFPQQVRHYDDFDLQWQASSDGGTTWTDVGTSSNDVYLTWQDPTVSPLYHTVVHLGSHNAQGIGGTDSGPVVTAIWGDFSDRNTQRVDGTQMAFYRNKSASATNTAGLLRDANGQCGAWAWLLMDVLSGQGIPSTRITVREATHPGTYGFLVKNWDFQGNGVSQQTAPYVYVQSVDLFELPGVAGQEYNDPPSDFVNHFIVRYGGQYYDPSYGGPVYATQADWENASIDGFGYLANWQGVPRIHAKKNDPAVIETQFV